MSDTLWSGQVPDTTDNADGAPGITTATTIQVVQARSCTGIQFRATDTKGGTYTAELWQCTVADDDVPDGTLLASKAVAAAAITAGVYNEISFTTPVALSTGVLYRCALHNTDGRYVRSGAFFGSPLTSGDITAYANGTDPSPPGLGGMRQGSFRVADAGNYPTQSGNGASYFVGPALAALAVEGSGAAALGSLVATAVGSRSKQAAGVAALGALVGTAAGSRSRTGAATAALGQLSAIGAATRAKVGSGVANLGRLIATATTEASTVVPRPDIGTVLRPSTGIIEVPRITYP